jgi:hypothetical protein
MKIEIGDKVSFTYIKDVEKALVNGVLVSDYAKNSERYSGEVVEIRDIEHHGLSNETLRYLITVEDEDGFSKAFYDGRMMNCSIVKPDAVAS